MTDFVKVSQSAEIKRRQDRQARTPNAAELPVAVVVGCLLLLLVACVVLVCAGAGIERVFVRVFVRVAHY